MKLRISRPLEKPEGEIAFIAEAPSFPSLGAIYASFRDMPESDAIRHREFREFQCALDAIEKALLHIEQSTPSGSCYRNGTFEFIHQ